jgi:SM-20-related protein
MRSNAVHAGFDTVTREDRAAHIARQLAERGFAVIENALDAVLLEALSHEARCLYEQDEYDVARVGTGDERKLALSVRSDRIHWIDEHAPSAPQQGYLGFLDDVRAQINLETFMGLARWEGHLAVYPIGSFYRRHLDVFANARERKVSTVLYLNPEWRPGDGGELRLWTTPASQGAWDPEGPFVDIEPRFGTLVAFLSEDYYHEVLPAHARRFSVTGWFRVRDLSLFG